MNECYECHHQHKGQKHCYWCCDRVHGREDAAKCRGAHPFQPAEEGRDD